MAWVPKFVTRRKFSQQRAHVAGIAIDAKLRAVEVELRDIKIDVDAVLLAETRHALQHGA